MFKFLKDKLNKLLKSEDNPDIEESKKSEVGKNKSKEKKTKSPKKEKSTVKKKEQVKEEKDTEKKPLPKLKEITKEKENKEDLDYITEELEERVDETSLVPEEKEEGFFSKLKRKFKTIKLDQELFGEFFEKLEMMLIENNVALGVIDKIREDMEKDLINIEIKKEDIEDEVKKSLKNSIKNILIPPFDLIEKIKEKEGPVILLFFGINGAGKTTTISKVAKLLEKNKINSIFAASDTFRAASIEQLKKHGENLGIKVISQDYGSDPAAVAFDAIKHAKAHGIKAVLIDTAGRMHTRDNLLKEMEKIIRVTNPDFKIFVAESITGNDATEQAKTFNEEFGIDGTILSKADVDEKGGTAISVGYITKKPILFLGTGQNYEDLEKFEVDEIISNLGLE